MGDSELCPDVLTTTGRGFRNQGGGGRPQRSLGIRKKEAGSRTERRHTGKCFWSLAVHTAKMASGSQEQDRYKAGTSTKTLKLIAMNPGHGRQCLEVFLDPRDAAMLAVVADSL